MEEDIEYKCPVCGEVSFENGEPNAYRAYGVKIEEDGFFVGMRHKIPECPQCEVELE
jgi:predicted RNA-binding Zn-ribbon protein involved in translation (DUF1610 family)